MDAPDPSSRPRPRPLTAVTAGGVLVGAGLGGFVDGIVLHQMLQWHHMLTAHGRYAHYPHTTVSDLEDNTVWDGVFHASTWLLVVAGLFLLVGAVFSQPSAAPSRTELLALLLVGWGAFNVVEGVVNHHLLTLHHVRDDVAEPLGWDLAFLGAGVLLIAAGLALRRATTQRPRA